LLELMSCSSKRESIGQLEGGSADLGFVNKPEVSQSRAVGLDALAGSDPRLAIERQVLGILDHLDDRCLGRHTASFRKEQALQSFGINGQRVDHFQVRRLCALGCQLFWLFRMSRPMNVDYNARSVLVANVVFRGMLACRMASRPGPCFNRRVSAPKYGVEQSMLSISHDECKNSPIRLFAPNGAVDNLGEPCLA